MEENSKQEIVDRKLKYIPRGNSAFDARQRIHRNSDKIEDSGDRFHRCDAKEASLTLL